MINVVFLTMMAALDSTNSALGMIFLYLAEHPDAQELVATDPGRIPTIIEELLRYEPISTTARVLSRDIELHGVTLRAGDQVLMPWGMAGRDPSVFENPDTVDFTRSSTRHLGFGIGPHRCLGMFVARSVLRIALEEWHARIPRYHVTPGCLPLRHYTQVRGLNNLEITIGAPRR
jgi:cytochrome P450